MDILHDLNISFKSGYIFLSVNGLSRRAASSLLPADFLERAHAFVCGCLFEGCQSCLLLWRVTMSDVLIDRPHLVVIVLIMTPLVIVHCCHFIHSHAHMALLGAEGGRAVHPFM